MFRILLAEDDDSLRRVLLFKLRQRNYCVQVAHDGAAALKILEESEYDLIISDICMPGLDGLELLRRAKELSSKNKVVLITAHGCERLEEQAYESGAYAFLTKPFDEEELFGIIDGLDIELSRSEL